MKPILEAATGSTSKKNIMVAAGTQIHICIVCTLIDFFAQINTQCTKSCVVKSLQINQSEVWRTLLIFI